MESYFFVWEGVVAFGDGLFHVFVPVEHVVLLKAVLCGAAMVLVHECHHLVVMRLPSFVLCHDSADVMGGKNKPD